MFSLIISLISIALVAALSLATISYFSKSFDKAGTEAKTTRLINETQQIQAAITMYRTANQDALPTSLEQLTTNGEYLNSLPPGAWRSNLAYIQTAAVDVGEDVCLSFNKKRNVPFIPACADKAYQSMVICCDESLQP